MPRRTFALLAVVALALAPLIGCGGGTQKGANKDKDRPHATTTAR